MRKVSRLQSSEHSLRLDYGVGAQVPGRAAVVLRGHSCSHEHVQLGLHFLHPEGTAACSTQPCACARERDETVLGMPPTY